MKKSISIFAILFVMAACLSNCTSVKEVGKLTMISTRNVDSKTEYTNLRGYVGSTKKELKKLKGKTVEEAVDNLVRTTPGGEFVKNVKVFVINSKYFAIQGDVWGYEEKANFKGFKVGDFVQWKDNFILFKGTITDLKDDKHASVKDESGKVRLVKYTEMQKAG